MAERYDCKYYSILEDKRNQYYEWEGSESFTYIELVESIRTSDIAFRFDFDGFHRDKLLEQRGEFKGHPFLSSKPIKAMKYKRKNEFPTFFETRIEIQWFDPYSKRSSIGISTLSYALYYRTITQLLMILRESFQMIDALQEKVVLEGDLVKKQKEHQKLVKTYAPGMLKEAFRGSDLPYNYTIGRETLDVIIRLPRNLKALFCIEFGKIEEKIADVVEEAIRLREACKTIGLTGLSKFSKEEWVKPEKEKSNGTT